jgi:hypothetical protein
MTILKSHNVNNFCKEGISELYDYFKADFLDLDLKIEKENISYDIDVKVNETCPCPFFHDEKQERFWHIITTDINVHKNTKINPCVAPKEKNRKYDKARAKRIHWIKPIIEQWQSDDEIQHFYQKRGNKINLILWHTTKSFLVVIRKLSNNSDRFLVSSYLVYTDQVHKYKKQLKEYDENKPTGLEWF